MKTPSTVSRCALLFGVPVSHAEYLDRTIAEPPSDYLTHVLRGEKPEDVWSQHYCQIASQAQTLIDLATDFGATVYTRATLPDWSEASSLHDRLILLTHWKGSTVVKGDLLAQPSEFVARIGENSHVILHTFKTVRATLTDLLDAFNSAITRCNLIDFLPQTMQQACKRSSVMGRTLSRDLIDEAFAGLINPGNRVEFFDGLHLPGAVEEAIPSDFHGEIDLGTCNSEMLATIFDLRRGESIQHLHWPVEIDPIPQYICIAEALRRLTTSGHSYINARLSVEGDL